MADFASAGAALVAGLANAAAKVITSLFEEPQDEPGESANIISSHEPGRYRPRTPSDVYYAAFLLRQVLVPDVIPQILDLAEYWPYNEVETNEERRVTRQNRGQIYLVCPVPDQIGPSSIRKVVFTVTSHDQGWSSYPQFHGTYEGSWTWFEAVIFEPDAYSLANVMVPARKIITNVHADRRDKTHIVEWCYDALDQDERSLLKELKCGRRVAITAWADFPGWENLVSGAKIEIYFSCVRR